MGKVGISKGEKGFKGDKITGKTSGGRESRKVGCDKRSSRRDNGDDAAEAEGTSSVEEIGAERLEEG